MPLFIKIDFRGDGALGVWFTRDEGTFHKTTTTIKETRIREALIALADEIDPVTPEEIQEPS